MSGPYNSGKWFSVRNWKQFQHYGNNRTPPWVKLHFSILSSEDWVMLDDASRVLAIACMLVASRNEGHVPNNPHFMQRVAYLKRPANFKPLLECKFLENPLATDSALLADASTMLADARPNKIREEKKESSSSDDDGFGQWWNAYPRKVGKQAAAKAYAKAVKTTTPDRLLATLEQQKPSWTDPKFIPHPTTWLNRGQWDDEPALFKPKHLDGII